MAFVFNSVGTALRYRGREGMWSWILHRLTGLGVLAFLIIHVVETAVVIYWPEFYDDSLALYRSPFFRLMELIIFFSVLFHAANGLRIVIQDFYPMAMLRQRELTWGVAAVVILAMLPITWMMMAPIFGLADEPGTARAERERRVLIEQSEVQFVPVAPLVPEEVIR